MPLEKDKSDFDLIILSGFWGKGIQELSGPLERSLSPKQTITCDSMPWFRVFEEPERLAERVDKTITSNSEADRRLIVAYSYGALIALIYACRSQFKKVLKLVLIDGPINSHVEVKPARFIQKLCYKQYDSRARLALACEKTIEAIDVASLIVTIGTSMDRIVPPEAKKLPGRFQDISLSDDENLSVLDGLDSEKGQNITLPSCYRGHGLKDEKVLLVTNIISRLLRQGKNE